jgi:hypothetical protein
MRRNELRVLRPNADGRAEGVKMAAAGSKKSLSMALSTLVRGQREKRVRRRRQTERPGVAEFGATKLPCVILDLNDAGARISVKDVSALPSRFQLCIIDTGEIRRATVAWRRGSEAGLSFPSARR